MVRFDHALIFVTDLRAAVRDYTALGFSVVAGGAHHGEPTENALIPFSDGTYLELIAFRRRRTLALLRILARLRLVSTVARAPLARRFATRAADGAGLIDVTVCVDAVGPAIDAAARAGIVVHGPVAGRRTAAGGETVAWELGVPDHEELPLVIADTTPRSRRVAVPPDLRHANGVTGIAGATVAAHDPAAAADRLCAVLGVPGAPPGALAPTGLGFAPVGGRPAGRPLGLVLTGGTPGRLDVRRAHGAVLDLR